MTIDDLKCIVRLHGSKRLDDWYYLGGCEVLEHVEDVEEFILLLREFRNDNSHFVDDYPNPIRLILDGGFRFNTGPTWASIVVNMNCYFYRGGGPYYEY
jgi:hypothetical protein